MNGHKWHPANVKSSRFAAIVGWEGVGYPTGIKIGYMKKNGIEQCSKCELWRIRTTFGDFRYWTESGDSIHAVTGNPSCNQIRMRTALR